MKSWCVLFIVLMKGKKSKSVWSVCRFFIYRFMFKVDCENGFNFFVDVKGLGWNFDIMNRDNGYKYKKRWERWRLIYWIYLE